MIPAAVEKRHIDGALAIRYVGDLISHGETETVFGGRFTFDVPKPYVHFRAGDRTIEYFYSDRWYNIHELRDVDDDRLKGWYCNIARPATVSEGADGVTISYIDLALDVFVSPIGDVLVLDEDELAALNLPAPDLARVWAAVDQLRGHIARREIPFNSIEG